MTPDQALEAAAVLTAFANGRKIEVRNLRIPDAWNREEEPLWNFGYCDYRVAPEPSAQLFATLDPENGEEVPACPECVQGYVQETGFDRCEKCNPAASGVEARVCEDMNDRPTPLTDEASFSTVYQGELVKASFARDLERKLAEANEQIAAMAKHEAAALESDSVVASCNCGKKSPDIQHHARGCRYRLIVERDESRTKLAEANEEVMGWRKLGGNLQDCAENLKRIDAKLDEVAEIMREKDRQLAVAREALLEIASRDWIENALNPQNAKGKETE